MIDQNAARRYLAGFALAFGLAVSAVATSAAQVPSPTAQVSPMPTMSPMATMSPMPCASGAPGSGTPCPAPTMKP
jgi:hypothetical protein